MLSRDGDGCIIALMHDAAPDKSHHRAQVLDPVLGHVQIILIEHRHVGEFSRFKRAFQVFFESQAGAAVSGGAQRVLAAQPLRERDLLAGARVAARDAPAR